MRHAEAYAFMRLTWRPRRGDRVYFRGLRTHVTKVTPGRGIKVLGHRDYLYHGQVEWRPTPRDFYQMVVSLEKLWVYRELRGFNRWIVGVMCRGRVTPIQGRALRILSQVLALRALEPNINSVINERFEHSRVGTHAQLHPVQPKGRSAARPTVCK